MGNLTGFNSWEKQRWRAVHFVQASWVQDGQVKSKLASFGQTLPVPVTRGKVTSLLTHWQGCTWFYVHSRLRCLLLCMAGHCAENAGGGGEAADRRQLLEIPSLKFHAFLKHVVFRDAGYSAPHCIHPPWEGTPAGKGLSRRLDIDLCFPHRLDSKMLLSRIAPHNIRTDACLLPQFDIATHVVVPQVVSHIAWDPPLLDRYFDRFKRILP